MASRKKKLRRKQRGPSFRWETLTQYILTVKSQTRVLAVTALRAKEMWLVAAFETTRNTPEERALLKNKPVTQNAMTKTVDQVFDNHAHETIGVFRTPKIAQRKAESYARAWLKKQIKLDPCDCGPIDLPPFRSNAAMV